MSNPPPPGPPPPGGWPPHPGWQPPPRKSTGEVVGFAVVGAFLYFVINVVVWFTVVNAVSHVASKTVVGLTNAVVLAVIAFGVGGALLAVHTPRARGLGLGLMIGWGIASILSVGLCTGVNPAMYGYL
ncbi:hypothetical protein ACAG26_08395 [Mycobacterium sp. pUA109]|uniref:hypothetical protein n=1 Tax=Mycobacterium sp. pUA109 TaxID=3238982 RepID=UPI00351B91D7